MAKYVLYLTPQFEILVRHLLGGLNRFRQQFKKSPKGGSVDLTDQRLCRVKMTFVYEKSGGVLP